jgi:hypothetical protein
MKITHCFLGISASLMVLSSCYSTRPIGDDDLYVVKNSALPPGESLTDETTYSTYKYRKNRNDVSNSYYYERNNYFFQPYSVTSFWYPSTSWGMYAGHNHMMIGYMYQPYGYSHYAYDPFYYNPYFYRPPANYGYSYSTYYNDPYAQYPNNGLNGGSNLTGQNPNQYKNTFSGPRGSISGIANPQGRQSISSQVKSHQQISPIYSEKRSSDHAAYQVVRPVSSNKVIIDGNRPDNYTRNSRSIERTETQKQVSRTSNKTVIQRNYRTIDQNSNHSINRERIQTRPIQREQYKGNTRMESEKPNTIRNKPNSNQQQRAPQGGVNNRRKL